VRDRGQGRLGRPQQFVAAPFEPASPDVPGHRLVLAGEEPVELPDRDEVRRGDPGRVQLGIAQVVLDVPADLTQQRTPAGAARRVLGRPGARGGHRGDQPAELPGHLGTRPRADDVPGADQVAHHPAQDAGDAGLPVQPPRGQELGVHPGQGQRVARPGEHQQRPGRSGPRGPELPGEGTGGLVQHVVADAQPALPAVLLHVALAALDQPDLQVGAGVRARQPCGPADPLVDRSDPRELQPTDRPALHRALDRPREVAGDVELDEVLAEQVPPAGTAPGPAGASCRRRRVHGSSLTSGAGRPPRCAGVRSAVEGATARWGR
jgi:hypothetical protein